jgi:hypothetical protein
LHAGPDRAAFSAAGWRKTPKTGNLIATAAVPDCSACSEGIPRTAAAQIDQA